MSLKWLKHPSECATGICRASSEPAGGGKGAGRACRSAWCWRFCGWRRRTCGSSPRCRPSPARWHGGWWSCCRCPRPRPRLCCRSESCTRVRALLLRWRCCACVACMHGAACRNLDAEVESDHAGLLSAVVSRGAAHKSPDCRVWGGHCPGKKNPTACSPESAAARVVRPHSSAGGAQVFNSRTCSLVLGAGAMQSARLRSITAKHLALSAQAVGAVIAAHPLLRGALAAPAPHSRRALMSPDFDRLLQVPQPVSHVDLRQRRPTPPPFPVQGWPAPTHRASHRALCRGACTGSMFSMP